MKSIEKLRNYFKGDGMAHGAIHKLIDDVEREIAERFVELPVDADGVPIRCGDVVDGGMGDSGKVQHVELWPDGFVVVYECHPGTFTRYAPDAVRHVKERTIEDVLREFGDWYKHVAGGCDEPGIIAEYADELRGMGVGE